MGGGTSDAAPVVAGIAALVLSVKPDLTAVEVKRILMASATKLPSLRGKVGCGGMVNAYQALLLALLLRSRLRAGLGRHLIGRYCASVAR